MKIKFNQYFATGPRKVAKSLSLAKANVYARYGKYGNVNTYKVYGNSSMLYN